MDKLLCSAEAGRILSHMDWEGDLFIKNNKPYEEKAIQIEGFSFALFYLIHDLPPMLPFFDEDYETQT